MMISKRTYDIIIKICKIYAVLLGIGITILLVLTWTMLIDSYIHRNDNSYNYDYNEYVETASPSMPCETSASLTSRKSTNTESINEETVIVEEVPNVYKTDIVDESIILETVYSSVFKWQIYNGDFETEQLYVLEKYCNLYDIPIEIMLSVICCESSFTSTVLSDYSTAAGYCQILGSTAKWIYEEKLKYGEYDIDNHDEIMTTNWELNIELGCYLMRFNYDYHGNTWESALKRYHGSKIPEQNEKYLNKINTRMDELFNMGISDFSSTFS